MYRPVRLFLEKIQETIDSNTEYLLTNCPNEIGAMRHTIGFINGLQEAKKELEEILTQEDQ